MKTGRFRRRTWEQLRAWRERSAPLRRYVRLRPVNGRRAAAKRAEAFGPQAKLCEASPCCTCGRAPTPDYPNEPHHEPPRKRGGWGGKDRDTCSLCFDHHTERHSMPLADFERKHRVNLRAEVIRMREAVAYG